MHSNCGIYGIKNLKNGWIYIGSSKHIRRRWHQHRALLNAGAHDNQKLQRAWMKYGVDAFVFEVIALMAEERLMVAEQEILDGLNFRHCYNIARFADASMRGRPAPSVSAANKTRVWTEEMRARLVAGLTGRKMPDGHGQKVRDYWQGRKRSQLSSAHRIKLSEAHRGQKPSAAAIEKTRERYKGQKLSDEHRAKISASRKGRVTLTPEHREKLRVASTGRRTSAETRTKIAAFRIAFAKNRPEVTRAAALKGWETRRKSIGDR